MIRAFRPLALTVVVAASGWQASSPPGDLVKIERDDEAMGSSFSLVLYGHDRASLETAADAAFEEAHRLDRLLSNYLPASEWSGMNRDAASRPVVVSPELFALLSSCLEYSRQSHGAFDITVGPLVKTWGFYKGEGSLPRPADVRAALDRVGYRHVELNAEARTVRFTRQGIDLDPGGIGKGYAVDRMVDVLKRAGVQVALVSASGSSVYGMGAPPGEPRGLADDDPCAAQPRRGRRRGLPEGQFAVDVGQLREVLLGGGTDLLAHHGSAHRLSRSGHGVGLRRLRADDRQRGVDEALLHQRPRVDGSQQAEGLAGVLL